MVNLRVGRCIEMSFQLTHCHELTPTGCIPSVTELKRWNIRSLEHSKLEPVNASLKAALYSGSFANLHNFNDRSDLAGSSPVARNYAAREREFSVSLWAGSACRLLERIHSSAMAEINDTRIVSWYSESAGKPATSRR